MTYTSPAPDPEKKTPSVYVSDPGKRQVIYSNVDSLSWNGNGKMSFSTGTPSSVKQSALTQSPVSPSTKGFITAVMSNLQFTCRDQR